MRTFNAIQMIILLMASPTLISLLNDATFSGARPLFWLSIIGTLILAGWNVVLVRIGIDKD